MVFETLRSPGLAHLSYLVGDADAGSAVVIDPRRDVEEYLEKARAKGVRIDYVVETHIHADFVSGGPELASRTGAKLLTGRSDEISYRHEAMDDGDSFEVGPLQFRALQTPGHTPEHISLVVSGGKGSKEPWGVFTGDTLFAGEVGRPDLLGREQEQALAKELYHSLHAKLLALEDGVIVYPSHGEGSPCGGSIGDRDTTTIGYERRHNPKLAAMSEEDFVRLVLEGASEQPAPSYYPRMKKLNAKGVVGGLPDVRPLQPQEVADLSKQEGVLLLDARPYTAFGGAHIPGALNVALQEEFPIWCGWLVKPEHRVVLVLNDPGDLEEAQTHLFRIGIDRIEGYLAPGMPAWFAKGLPIQSTAQIDVHRLRDRIGEIQLLDVRRQDEWREGRLPTAVHRYLPEVPNLDGQLDRRKPVATYCESGYRASIAASLLERMGFERVHNVPGSMDAWRSAGFEIVPDPTGSVKGP
ncbi:MAG TPA: rhodanese-like domain-containing protein [Fimbriimonas sp.]